jgi:hypothetical protein
MRYERKNLDSGNVHVLRDQQGKLYLATKEPFGWLSLDDQPLMYGYRDHGSIEVLWNKLAQYQHAARILQGGVKTQFQQVLALFAEIEK